MAGQDNFNPGDDDPGQAPNLYEEATFTDYDSALYYAGQVYNQLAPDAQEDLRIVAVGEMGTVQMIGTGAVIPANDQQVLAGPAILVYAKDVREVAAELQDN